MLKIINPDQIKEITLQESKVLYIYGKIGSGKTYFSKQLMKKNNKNALYTTFEEIMKNISNELYMVDLLGKDFIIIDDGIKQIANKEMFCISIEQRLKQIQDKKKGIIVIGSLEPEELKKRKTSFIDFILSGEQIEICYDIDARIKIAEKYSKQCETVIMKDTLKAIAKEENLGKIKGVINQMSIQY